MMSLHLFVPSLFAVSLTLLLVAVKMMRVGEGVQAVPREESCQMKVEKGMGSLGC